MEIIAIDMKLRGMYMARQLSFAGVTFSINEVELSDKFVEAYDASVKLVSLSTVMISYHGGCGGLGCDYMLSTLKVYIL